MDDARKLQLTIVYQSQAHATFGGPTLCTLFKDTHPRYLLNISVRLGLPEGLDRVYSARADTFLDLDRSFVSQGVKADDSLVLTDSDDIELLRALPEIIAATEEGRLQTAPNPHAEVNLGQPEAGFGRSVPHIAISGGTVVFGDAHGPVSSTQSIRYSPGPDLDLLLACKSALSLPVAQIEKLERTICELRAELEKRSPDRSVIKEDLASCPMCFRALLAAQSPLCGGSLYIACC